jgi:hypothetical protein
VNGTTYNLSLANSTVDDEILTVSLGPQPQFARTLMATPQSASEDTKTEDLYAGSSTDVLQTDTLQFSQEQFGTSAVPEPATWASAALAAGGIFLFLRKRFTTVG